MRWRESDSDAWSAGILGASWKSRKEEERDFKGTKWASLANAEYRWKEFFSIAKCNRQGQRICDCGEGGLAASRRLRCRDAKKSVRRCYSLRVTTSFFLLIRSFLPNNKQIESPEFILALIGRPLTLHRYAVSTTLDIDQ